MARTLGYVLSTEERGQKFREACFISLGNDETADDGPCSSMNAARDVTLKSNRIKDFRGGGRENGTAGFNSVMTRCVLLWGVSQSPCM